MRRRGVALAAIVKERSFVRTSARTTADGEEEHMATDHTIRGEIRAISQVDAGIIYSPRAAPRVGQQTDGR
jgi:hypothetical protein